MTLGGGSPWPAAAGIELSAYLTDSFVMNSWCIAAMC